MSDSPLIPLPDPTAVEPRQSILAPPRTQQPVRNQVEMRMASLDTLLPPVHPVRDLWAFVQTLNLAPWYDAIQARANTCGRPPIDPRILFALWLQATLDGIGSARLLDRHCKDHAVYQWICGGVSVNYHTLADFRVERTDALDELLTECVGVLIHQEVVTLERVAQDGMRVRGAAGGSSFRRKPTLDKCLEEAREQVEELRQELHADPGAGTRREQAARERAAQEREERLEAAIRERAQIAARKPANEQEKIRVSTTDPEVRVMKMADGGFRPALNVEIATDTASGIIVGVAVTNHGSDRGELLPMVEQLEARYDHIPQEYLVDGGFVKGEDFDALEGKSEVYAPVKKTRDKTKEPVTGPFEPHRGDSAAVIAWRKRMATPEAQTIYKERASTAEWVNALMRQCGLLQFRVRGMKKALATVLWQVLAHNMRRSFALAAEK